MIIATPEDIARFMSFVEILPNGCWFWSGARSRGKGNKKWYGTFWVNREIGSVRAHRFSCDVFGKRPLPKVGRWHRDHNCCFSLCVNEKHLDIVTHEENELLKKARQRATRN